MDQADPQFYTSQVQTASIRQLCSKQTALLWSSKFPKFAPRHVNFVPEGPVSSADSIKQLCSNNWSAMVGQIPVVVIWDYDPLQKWEQRTW